MILLKRKQKNNNFQMDLQICNAIIQLADLFQLDIKQYELFYFWIKNCMINRHNFGLLTKQNFQTLRLPNRNSYSLKKTHYSLRSSEKQLQTLSYTNPNIQLQKSLQFKSPDKTLQRKTSNFLKSYIQKLKRQRKRVNKKQAQLNPRSLNKKQPSFFQSHHQSQILQRQSSILIFKKSQLLDTRGNYYNKLQKYSKDAKFQALLEQIKVLKKKQQEQNQKECQMQMEIQLKIQVQKQKSKTSKMISVKKYDNNLNLNFPVLNKTFYKLPSLDKKQGQIKKQESQSQQFQCQSQRKPSVRTKQRIQRFYNFKSLQPWQSTKQNIQLQEIAE